ncbi:hypothetical protein Y032_0010g1044 [Ancylostoma ceylanicum]|uniref:Uncharacterized protein n=1 Tax=Ancylostoma ceylanicum TaxID=53326 RepID=A0A016VG25_9BILA|nr:hypothetical protein Y032_0010g1044 [Ancylostoma ceylanicum]
MQGRISTDANSQQRASLSNPFRAKPLNAQDGVIVHIGHARLFCAKFGQTDYQNLGRGDSHYCTGLSTLLVWRSHIPHNSLSS